MALLPVLFLGCKKDNVKPVEELIEVTLSAEGFNQTFTPMGLKASARNLMANTTTVPLAERMTKLELFVFDMQNKLVTSKLNTLIDAAGNSIADSDKFTVKLPRGNYRVKIIAHNRTINISGATLDTYFIYYDYSKENPFKRNIIDYKELYSTPFTEIKVENDSSFPAFKLSRINSNLQLEIKDEIPTEVSYILVGGKLSYFIHPFNDAFTFYPSDGFIKFDVQSLVGKSNQLISSNIFGKGLTGNEAIDLDILYFSKDHILLGTKTAKSVIFKQNTITKLSGTLFEALQAGEKTSGISTEFVKEYSTEIINKTF